MRLVVSNNIVASTLYSTFGGDPVVGDKVIVEVEDTCSHSNSWEYIVQSGDTMSSIIAALIALINVDTNFLGAQSGSNILTVNAQVCANITGSSSIVLKVINSLFISNLNPVKFHLVNQTEIPQYKSRHMDDNFFVDTIRDYEQQLRYCQKWTLDDSIRLQVISNYAPLELYLKDEYGKTLFTEVFETRQQDFFRPGYYIRQAELDLGSLIGLEEGHYFLMINDTHISEPIEIVEDFPNSVLAEYSNSKRYGDLIFASPFEPSIRLGGILKYKNPGGIATVYADQKQNETILKYVPYRVWRFILADKRGVPPWLIDKVDRIFGCDNLKLDGRLYTRPNSQFEIINELEGYPMAGWAIDLREKLNRESIQYENDIAITGMASMMAVTDTKGFGMDDNGGDFLEITDVN